MATEKANNVPETSNTDKDVEVQDKETTEGGSKRHSFYSAIPLTRRMQEGAWGKFQERGRRSLERLQNRVSSRFMGRPINLYIAIVGVFFAIIATIVYVEIYLRPKWRTAEEQLLLDLAETPAPLER
uniref:Uncharacterized LOC100178891 n=2 Tax=Ciona intestinalis TaxID=7719 RepID=F6YXI3_CIOIN|nr:uncharacterized protein LOC100178891 isoform X2 [Ciona intestinalis]|eukprot:XP_002128539.1 uncharacterized protein LOC100178891 isoform X2 [Ciona intestinalis]